MGDRVAFIGGSTSGRDHFPFPVTNGDSTLCGTGKAYPRAFTLAEVLHLLFVCKIWRFTIGNVSWQSGTSIFPSFYDDYPHLTPFPDSDPQTRESELVVYSAIESKGLPREFVGGGQTYTYLESFLNLGFANFAAPVVYYSGQLWPSLTCGFSYEETDESTPAPNFDFEAVSTYDGELNNGLPAGTLTISTSLLSGVTIPLFKVYNDYEADISLECIEYWPYATKTGLPVYNTSTGAQINDPLS